jgi:O-antigen/teichoic acid export membrane protein
VGFYVISVGIAEKLWMLSQTVSTVLYPKLASMKDEGEKNRFTPVISRNVLLITVAGAFAIFLLSKWLILLLFSEEYLPSIRPLQVLLIGVIALSVTRLLSSDIDARGKPIINTYIGFIVVITNMILNILLIPKFGIMGAAWATSISYSLNLIVKLFVYCRLSGNPVADVIMFKKSDIKLYLEVLTAANTKIRQRVNLSVEKWGGGKK